MNFNDRLLVVKRIIELRDSFYKTKNEKHFNEVYEKMLSELLVLRVKFGIKVDRRVVLMGEKEFEIHLQHDNLKQFVVDEEE